MSSANRLRAIALYKELHRLGRDYPNPSYVRFWNNNLTLMNVLSVLDMTFMASSGVSLLVSIFNP